MRAVDGVSQTGKDPLEIVVDRVAAVAAPHRVVQFEARVALRQLEGARAPACKEGTGVDTADGLKAASTHPDRQVHGAKAKVRGVGLASPDGVHEGNPHIFVMFVKGNNWVGFREASDMIEPRVGTVAQQGLFGMSRGEHADESKGLRTEVALHS